jgi:hypothetical protein
MMAIRMKARSGRQRGGSVFMASSSGNSFQFSVGRLDHQLKTENWKLFSLFQIK